MATRSSSRWKVKPGSFDAVNAELLFDTKNSFGIPDLAAPPPIAVSGDTLPAWLAPFRTRILNPELAAQGGLHGYLDDYRLESLWTRPRKSLEAVQQFGTLVTPDYSLYRDWPIALQIYNTYRSRWLGAFWQSHGLRVVPSVSWSGRLSYEFCFLGIPPGSVVSISTVGILYGDKTTKRLFVQGFETMLERLHPAQILCYGDISQEFHERAAAYRTGIVTYPTRWVGLRKDDARKQQYQLNQQQLG